MHIKNDDNDKYEKSKSGCVKALSGLIIINNSYS